jgi:alcohol oxidase
MYTRAAASDYDDWATIHQNPGWGSKDLIPLAQKLETYQVDPTAPTHGTNGPLKISYGYGLLNVGRQFLEVAKLYDTTRGYTEDVNDFHTVNAFGRWPKYIIAKSPL